MQILMRLMCYLGVTSVQNTKMNHATKPLCKLEHDINIQNRKYRNQDPYRGRRLYRCVPGHRQAGETLGAVDRQLDEGTK